jgi:hypothetical protein
MTRSSSNGDIYGEVNTMEDIRVINRRIRSAMKHVKERGELTELKKRSDYLCTLTFAPSWRSKFGRKSGRFLHVAESEDRRSTRVANSIARRKGFDVEYHAWRSNWDGLTVNRINAIQTGKAVTSHWIGQVPIALVSLTA